MIKWVWFTLSILWTFLGLVWLFQGDMEKSLLRFCLGVACNLSAMRVIDEEKKNAS